VITTFRAALAVALLAGFYLLVAGFIAAAAVLDFFAVTHLGAAGIRVVLAANVGALVAARGAFAVGGRRKGQRPGVCVTALDEPGLWYEVDGLAARVRTRAPDEIRIVADANAAVSESTRLLGLWPGQRVLYIGMPLFLSLSVDELRAVLCHELGHYGRSHTRLGAVTYQGDIALAGTIRQLRSHATMRRIFMIYARLYFSVSHAVLRRQELEADAAAVAVAGRRAAGDAVRKVRASAAAWDYYLNAYCALIEPARARPANLFAGYYTLLRQPSRQQEFNRAALAPETRSRYDSHPSLAERLAAIDRLDEPAVTPDPRPALALLASPQAVATATQHTLLTGQALGLPVLEWPEILARGMTALRADAVNDVFAAAAQVAKLPAATVDTILWALATGQSGSLADRLRALSWRGDDPQALVAAVVARAFEGLLVQAGRAHWAFSWSDAVTLLDTSGLPVRGADPVLRAVHDPGQVGALRDWLADQGIPLTGRPQEQVPA
jgi:Zn-dependent protease with chaperone function